MDPNCCGNAALPSNSITVEQFVQSGVIVGKDVMWASFSSNSKLAIDIQAIKNTE